MHEPKTNGKGLQKRYGDARALYSEGLTSDEYKGRVVQHWLRLAFLGGTIAFVGVSAMITMSIFAVVGMRSLEHHALIVVAMLITDVGWLFARRTNGATAQHRAEKPAQSRIDRTSPRKTRSPPLAERGG